MLKVSSFHRVRKGAWLLAVLCVVALGASACQISPSTPSNATPTPTRTPTAPVDYSALDEPSATATSPDSNQASGSGNGDSDGSDDVCSLISQDEAEEVLGQTVTSITPGVDNDSIAGETINFCTYLGFGQALVLSVVDTGSMDSVGPTIDQELANLEDGDEVPAVIQVLGLGDQAFWATTSHAGSYVVQTGTVVFSLALGGNIDNPADYKDALQRLAGSVAGRF
jgi:hypothetical protein